MNPEIQEEKQVSWSVISIIIVAVLALVVWLLVDNSEPEAPAPVVIQEEVVEETVKLDPLPMVEDEPEPTIEPLPEPVVEPELPKLPDLNDSDNVVIEKLPDLTWRKELLKLLVTEDLIRRFVVFTDNFAQGSLSYDHSPFIVPVERFFAENISDEANNQAAWQWDESSTRRFSLYVDLLRSMDSGELVSFYYEIKPLIDQAYQELGYPEEDFTHVLQASIIRVLDMQLPEHTPQLTRPSVMYKYQDEELEALDDADKLLLRIGKENILVIKSVLLEINDKLSRANNG